jgi:hypothetical protein
MPKAAKRATVRRRAAKQPSDEVLAAITALRKNLAIGARCYQKAEALLATLKAKLGVGKQVDIGNGLTAAVVDLFESDETQWKHVPVRRYELQLFDDTGKQTRLRDRKQKRQKKLF